MSPLRVSGSQWTPDQITQAREQFEATKHAIEESGEAPPMEPEVVDAVMQ
ncbi:hypothetical protein [Streptomyces chartreusis]